MELVGTCKIAVSFGLNITVFQSKINAAVGELLKKNFIEKSIFIVIVGPGPACGQSYETIKVVFKIMFINQHCRYTETQGQSHSKA